MDPITMSNKTAVTVPPQQGFLRSLDLTDSKTTARLVCLLLPFPFLLHYLIGLAYFHWTHIRPKDKQIPPTLPHLVPLLGSALPFAFDCTRFIKRATQYAGSLVPVRLSILAGDIFLIQGPKNVAAVWKEQQLGSPIFIYTFALQHVFGMPKRALTVYRADNSGSHRRPHPQSDVAPNNRVDFLTHQILFKAFGGSGLSTSFDRCAGILRRNLEALNLPEDEWTEMPDLWAFFQSQMGTAVLEGLYGPTLGRLSPSFLQDLWAFDRATPNLAKLVPKFLIPEAYKAYVTRSSPHRDVVVGRWQLPRDKVCMVNTYASHMDEGFWNTRGGKYPVDSFWAERFIIDPEDAGSGPVRGDVQVQGYKRPVAPPSAFVQSGGDGKGQGQGADAEKQEPFFSVQGLEGAWIPYGGGYAACPGRHFAKRIILYTTALLVAAFEVEVLTNKLEMDDRCFGLGTQKPKHEVKLRIRRRTQV